MARTKMSKNSGSKSSSMEKIMDQLKKDIEHGRIAPGQRLVTSEVAAEMGTSLAPVREAFHLLAGEGLLELLPNRGARVRSLELEQLLEGMEVIQVVGALAIRLAAKKMPAKENRKALEAELRNIQKAGQRRDPREFFRSISRSHRLVNDIAGNSYLNPVIDRLHLEYFNSQLSELLPGNWEQYVKNYETMGKLIKAGKPEEVEEELVKHYEWVKSLIREKMAESRED